MSISAPRNFIMVNTFNVPKYGDMTQGFVLYGFPEENSLCILSLVIIVVHVILSDNILDHID